MTRREKIKRVIVNSVLMVAIAALGVTVYRTGNEERERSELARQELAMQETQTEDEEPEDISVDAGTSQVEAELQEDHSLDSSAESVQEENSEEGQETAGEPDVVEMEEEPVSAIPTVNFTEDTLMIWPLAGDILLDYSMDQTIYHPTLDVYKYNPAIVISAAEGSPVLAAANGTVASIAENEETGTTVTLDMGNGYQAVYGQLQDVQVGEGQTVGESTILGYVAPPTKYYSVEGSNLYFSMSKDGAAVDPIIYLP